MSTTLSPAAETLLREFAEPGTYFVTREDWPLVDELEKAGLVTSKRGAHAVRWKVYPTEEGMRRAQT